MPHNELKNLIPDVIRLAREAGEAIRRVYQRQFVVAQKSDFSPVTEADIASHEIILRGLEALTPTIPVISEEDEDPPFAQRESWQRLWLVDPLDGTREFIKRNNEFTVNIALLEGNDPVLGVVYAPMSDLVYFGSRAGGAFKQEGSGSIRTIQSRAWTGGHIVVAGSRSHRSERFNAFLKGFDSYEVICLGSSLKSCLVAEGRADIYVRFGPTSEWDTAAAHCIVKEAGGEILDFHMQPLNYNNKASLLNPPFIVVGDTHADWRAFLPE